MASSKSPMPAPEGIEIKDPRRVLAVALPESSDTLSKVIKDLSGTYPTKPAGSDTFAGTTHTLALSNAYYSVQVPVWLDLVENPEEWERNFLSDEAREVLDVLGGVVVIFELPKAGAADKTKAEATRKFIDHIGRVVEDGLGGIEWDGVAFAVGVGDVDFDADGQDVIDEWDEACQEYALEFVHLPIQGKQGMGRFAREMDEEEPDKKWKSGLERATEMLQNNDWSLSGVFSDDEGDEDGERPAIKPRRPDFDEWESDSEGEDEDEEGQEAGSSKKAGALGGGDAGLDFEKLGFGFDKEDFVGLRQAIAEAGQQPGGEDEAMDEGDVQKMESMMRRLLAVREMSAGMPEAQRKRMAKQAVDEVMKDL